MIRLIYNQINVMKYVIILYLKIKTIKKQLANGKISVMDRIKVDKEKKRIDDKGMLYKQQENIIKRQHSGRTGRADHTNGGPW